jgi:hypothetical protein
MVRSYMYGDARGNDDVVVDDDGFAFLETLTQQQPSAISVEKSRKVKLFSLEWNR